MRVAILGVGGLGRTLASELRADRRVTSLLLTDQFGERARVLTGIPGRVSIEATQLNVENHAALGRAIKGSDIVVNTTLPRYNLRIMGAALEAGAHYLDIAAAGPSEPGAQPEIFAQLARADDFKAAGRTALVSMGFDPGISNVMARDAAERFEAIDAIRIRAGELVMAPGPGYLPLSGRRPANLPRLPRGGGDPPPVPREARGPRGLQARPPSGCGPGPHLAGSTRTPLGLPHDPRREPDGFFPEGTP